MNADRFYAYLPDRVKGTSGVGNNSIAIAREPTTLEHWFSDVRDFPPARAPDLSRIGQYSGATGDASRAAACGNPRSLYAFPPISRRACHCSFEVSPLAFWPARMV